MRRQLFKRHNILLLLFIFIFIPGFLFAYGALFGVEKLYKKIRPNHKLTGITNNLEKPVFDLNHFKSHDIQKYIEQFFATQLPLRSIMIRFNNQIYYTFFNKSYVDAPFLVIGKHKQLFEQTYISVYCGWEGPALYTEQQLAEWADIIKKIHDFYKAQGKTFIYVISPSKAEYMPEAIPARFHCTRKGISPAVREMTKLLDQRHVPYINGPELMVAATQKYAIPMFAQGGIHWNDLGAAYTANQIITKINDDHRVHLPPLQFSYKMRKPKSCDLACDLLNLTNLLFPKRNYLAPDLDFVVQKSSKEHRKLSMVGGSFSGSLFDIFQKNKLFPEINYYLYLKLAEHTYANSTVAIKQDVDISHVIKNINNSDVIILEENSQGIKSSQAQLFYQLLGEYLDKKA